MGVLPAAWTGPTVSRFNNPSSGTCLVKLKLVEYWNVIATRSPYCSRFVVEFALARAGETTSEYRGELQPQQPKAKRRMKTKLEAGPARPSKTAGGARW